MQIVIDIDDNLYTRLFDNGDTDAVDMLKACVAIRKGTPLQKGHCDVFDKIIAEIEGLTITEGGDDYIRKMAELYSLKIKVLQIIDKYKAESEG